jgi:hypothetical protein
LQRWPAWARAVHRLSSDGEAKRTELGYKMCSTLPMPGTARQDGTALGTAWIFLCIALAVHVADETLTGFLPVWNGTVIALRSYYPWVPFPTFQFSTWLGGLIALIVALLGLSVFAFAGARWIRPLGYVLAVIMLGNGLGHAIFTLAGGTIEPVHLEGVMPGFYSSPLLVAASVYLLVQLRRTAHPQAHRASATPAR